MNSFVKQFIAAAKGDDVEVLAQKAWRSAESALKVNIASREGDTISLEDEVSRKKDTLVAARINNGKKVACREEYISELIDAKNELTDAEEELNNHLSELNFLKDEYAKLNADAVED